MPRNTRMGGRVRPDYFFGPLEASRKTASCFRRLSPRPANDGIGEPGLTHAGHFRCAIWNAVPLFFAPSEVKSGAPRLVPPAPLYVWQFKQPATANSFAPATACLFPAKPSVAAHFGTSAMFSDARGSF